MPSSSSLSAAVRLDLDAMRTVVAIADSTSVTRAASRLGRTPAALSMQLRKLEETLGRRLFERARSGMRPTPEGERLLPHARRMVDAERAARDAFASPVLEGRVRVGLIEDVGGIRLSDVLGAYARCYPSVVVEVVGGSSARLDVMLEEGELDLAVLTPGAAVAWRAGDRVVHEEPLVWSVAKGALGAEVWAARPLPLAVASDGCAWRRICLEALERAGTPYRIAYRSDAYAAIEAALSAGLAAAPLPLSRAVPGFRVLGVEDGAPPLGYARAALRLAPEADEAALALADRIVERFGGGSDAAQA